MRSWHRKEGRAVNIIGQNVMICGDHPHSGELGKVERVDKTLAGWGLYVKLDSCKHGTDACYVYKPENIVKINRLEHNRENK